eukprot:TRINITY_DN2434_c0_g1_i1.p1 TRINITY_DN2434_c0_g1~~TRINITY_DN2434_c0_g1_i1.p1  ORF type:complete len:564 (-),score=121.87 TRINITY_DN2434_c0_g1_i1:63-1754(-)
MSDNTQLKSLVASTSPLPSALPSKVVGDQRGVEAGDPCASQAGLIEKVKGIMEALMASPGYLMDGVLDKIVDKDVLDRVLESLNEGKQVDFGEVGFEYGFSAIKKYLKTLKSALPSEKFPNLLKIGEGLKDQKDEILQLVDYVSSLPVSCAVLLGHVCYFILRTTSNSDHNKMTLWIMSKIFGPLLFLDDSKLFSLKQFELSKRILQNLVLNYWDVFPKVTNITPDKPIPNPFLVHSLGHNLQEKKGINILCLDGGGIRGLILVNILQHLAVSMFGNADQDGTKKLLECFDLVCGTSTGGILSVGLSLGFTLSQARDIYLSMGSDIFQFGYSYFPARWARYYTSGDFYNSALLKDCFTKHFGETKMATISKKVFVTTTDATSSHWKPSLVRSYTAPEGQFEFIEDMSIPDALRTTSAAPTYFSPVNHDGKIYVDGGMVANNPTEIGIFEAHSLWQYQHINTIVSLGTGVPVDTKGSSNILKLVNEIVNIATDSELTHLRITEWLKFANPTPNYFRISPPELGSVKLDESDRNTLLDMERRTQLYMEAPEQKQLLQAIKIKLLQ